MAQVSSTRIPPTLADTLRRWSPRLVNLLLLAGIGWLVYQLALPWLPFAEQEPTEPAPVTAPVVAPEKPAAIPDRQMADWHLFGESAGSDDAEPATADAPETKLNLTLRGTYASKDMHHSVAIIQNNDDNKQQYFTLKQDVFGLATLEEIREDRVILKRAGRYETLLLPKKFLAGEHFLDSATIKAEKKRIASNYRNLFLGNKGMELIKLFGFQAHHRGGGFQGFVIKALGDEGREMLDTLGVMDGDLITVVNGKRLSEDLEAVASLKDLETATTIDIIIERDGSEIPFHFELDPPPDELVNPEPETEEDLGEDWGASEEDQRYMEELRSKHPAPTKRYELEYDH